MNVFFAFQVSGQRFSPRDGTDVSKSGEDNGSNSGPVEERADDAVDDVLSDQVLTLAIHERSPLHATAVGLSTGSDMAPSHSEELHEPLHKCEDGEVLVNGKMESPDSRSKNITAKNLEGNGSSIHMEHRSFGFGTKNLDYSPRKVNPYLFLFSSLLYLLGKGFWCCSIDYLLHLCLQDVHAITLLHGFG